MALHHGLVVSGTNSQAVRLRVLHASLDFPLERGLDLLEASLLMVVEVTDREDLRHALVTKSDLGSEVRNTLADIGLHVSTLHSATA